MLNKQITAIETTGTTSGADAAAAEPAATTHNMMAGI